MAEELIVKEVDDEDEGDDTESYGDSADSIEMLRAEFKNDLKEFEDRMRDGQLAEMNEKIDELIAAKVQFQDYTVEMIRDEVKQLRKKNINAQMEMKKQILDNFQIGDRVEQELGNFFEEGGITNPITFMK